MSAYVTIGGFEVNLDDLELSGGPQCERCGSWRDSRGNEEPDVFVDGIGYLRTGYTIKGSVVKCGGCGYLYEIQYDEED